MTSANWGVLLLAHGTVTELAELPSFLERVRRGRPAPPELVSEMEHRYRAIGGSPLLDLCRAQARALGERLGRPCDIAMRLWRPEVEEVVPKLVAAGVSTLCLLPLAPFSVEVYAAAARSAIERLGLGVHVVQVPPWGSLPGFVALQAEAIGRALKHDGAEHVVLTAHSLPRRVIALGDRYAAEFEASATAIGARLGVPFSLAYQSQGADGGDWLGPTLLETLQHVRQQGTKRVLVAPVGFVAEHVETLYDLDIEAKRQAQELGLDFVRVSAVTTEPEFIACLATLVEDSIAADTAADTAAGTGAAP